MLANFLLKTLKIIDKLHILKYFTTGTTVSRRKKKKTKRRKVKKRKGKEAKENKRGSERNLRCLLYFTWYCHVAW
jgi:transposase